MGQDVGVRSGEDGGDRFETKGLEVGEGMYCAKQDLT